MSERFASLRDYRSKRGLTLQAVAALFDVAKTTIMRWEGGIVPAERVREIERVTTVPKSALRPDLFGPEDDAEAPAKDAASSLSVSETRTESLSCPTVSRPRAADLQPKATP